MDLTKTLLFASMLIFSAFVTVTPVLTSSPIDNTYLNVAIDDIIILKRPLLVTNDFFYICATHNHNFLSIPCQKDIRNLGDYVKISSAHHSLTYPSKNRYLFCIYNTEISMSQLSKISTFENIISKDMICINELLYNCSLLRGVIGLYGDIDRDIYFFIHSQFSEELINTFLDSRITFQRWLKSDVKGDGKISINSDISFDKIITINSFMIHPMPDHSPASQTDPLHHKFTYQSKNRYLSCIYKTEISMSISSKISILEVITLEDVGCISSLYHCCSNHHFLCYDVGNTCFVFVRLIGLYVDIDIDSYFFIYSRIRGVLFNSQLTPDRYFYCKIPINNDIFVETINGLSDSDIDIYFYIHHKNDSNRNLSKHKLIKFNIEEDDKKSINSDISVEYINGLTDSDIDIYFDRENGLNSYSRIYKSIKSNIKGNVKISINRDIFVEYINVLADRYKDIYFNIYHDNCLINSLLFYSLFLAALFIILYKRMLDQTNLHDRKLIVKLKYLLYYYTPSKYSELVFHKLKFCVKKHKYDYCYRSSTYRRENGYLSYIYNTEISISLLKKIFILESIRNKTKYETFYNRLWHNRLDHHLLFDDINNFGSFFDEEIGIHVDIDRDIFCFIHKQTGEGLLSIGLKNLHKNYKINYIDGHKWTRSDFLEAGKIYINNDIYFELILGLTDREKDIVFNIYLNNGFDNLLLLASRTLEGCADYSLYLKNRTKNQKLIDLISYFNKEKLNFSMIDRQVKMPIKIDIAPSTISTVISTKLSNETGLSSIRNLEKRFSNIQSRVDKMSNTQARIDSQNDSLLEELHKISSKKPEDRTQIILDKLDVFKNRYEDIIVKQTQMIEKLIKDRLEDSDIIMKSVSQINFLSNLVSHEIGRPIPQISLRTYNSIVDPSHLTENFVNETIKTRMYQFDDQMTSINDALTKISTEVSSLRDQVKVLSSKQEVKPIPKVEPQVEVKKETKVEKEDEAKIANRTLTFDEDRIMKCDHIIYNGKKLAIGDNTKKSMIAALYDKKKFLTTLSSKINEAKLKERAIIYPEHLKFSEALIKLGVGLDLSKGLTITLVTKAGDKSQLQYL